MVRSGRRCLRRHKSTTGRGALLVKQAESASRRFVSEFLVIGFALVSGCPVLADEPMVFPSPRYDYHLQECARMNLLYTGIVSRLYGEGKRDSLATAV
ncbi:MAG: hypothetical protein ACE5GA_07835 [Candidatus Zixiibacteriota bacterium]